MKKTIKRNSSMVSTILVFVFFAIFTPSIALFIWFVGFLPFFKKRSFSQSFDVITKAIINKPIKKTEKKPFLSNVNKV